MILSNLVLASKFGLGAFSFNLPNFRLPKFGFVDLSEFITAIGTVLTAVWTWILGAIGAVEDAIAASFLLQLMVGVAVAYIAFAVLKKVISVVKSFKA